MTETEPLSLSLVPMVYGDIPDILEIEQVSFSKPWTEKDFVYSLDQSHGHARVCRVDGQLLGYIVGFRLRDEFHLADFAVRPGSQRRGYGSSLLDLLCAELVEMSMRAVTLEVRQSNQAAVRLYGRAGFSTVAIRKAYYTQPVEDALVMIKPLSGQLSDWVARAAGRMDGIGQSV